MSVNTWMLNNSWGTFKTAVIRGSCLHSSVCANNGFSVPQLSTIIQLYLLTPENSCSNLEMAEYYLTYSRWSAGFVGHQRKQCCLEHWKCCICSSHSNRYCSGFFTSNSCKVCIKKVQSQSFATRTSLTDTLDAGCWSQEVLLLFLVLGFLFRISSSWSLSQSLWNNSEDYFIVVEKKEEEAGPRITRISIQSNAVQFR